jgi:hypothetical protein
VPHKPAIPRQSSLPQRTVDPWLLQKIAQENSARMRVAIVEWVGNSAQRFSQVIQLVLHGSKIQAQRASYPMTFAVQAHPGLGKPYVLALLANLNRVDIHSAVIRHTMRTFRLVPLSPETQGPVMNAALAALSGPMEVAVKADAVSLLKILVSGFPEMEHEISLVIQEALIRAKPALYIRVRREFPLLLSGGW